MSNWNQMLKFYNKKANQYRCTYNQRSEKKRPKKGHVEKTSNIDEHCFVSPTEITVKRDKMETTPSDSQKLNGKL